jgi:hypothetical protein
VGYNNLYSSEKSSNLKEFRLYFIEKVSFKFITAYNNRKYYHYKKIMCLPTISGDLQAILGFGR